MLWWRLACSMVWAKSRPGSSSRAKYHRSGRSFADLPRTRLLDICPSLYPSIKGNPVEVQVGRGLNAYVIDGPNVLVRKAMKSLSPLLPVAVAGVKTC